MMLPESLFVTDKVHERTVTLPSGAAHALWFRELPQKVFNEFTSGRKSEDEDVRDAASAKLIAAGLCEPDGTPAMSFEQALNLKPAAINAILKELMAANEFSAGNS